MTQEDIEKHHQKLVEALKHFETLSHEQETTFKVHMARIDMLKSLYSTITEWKELRQKVESEKQTS